MSRNPQGDAARAAAAVPQSTHNVAAQASAARLIRALRSCYPDVIHTETETSQGLKEAQQYLCDYLAYLTNPDKNFAENKKLARHPAIVGTIRVIDHIVKNYSDPDKKNVLSQMRFIATTHPGFEKWADSDKQWSQNQIYNSAFKKIERVTASPAETLNLFCASLFDRRHMVATPGSDLDKDLGDRIYSLFSYLRHLFHEEQQGHYAICAAGRQHGILFLLNQVFCEIPGEPFVLIEDQATFALDALSEFIKMHFNASPEKSQEVVSDWISYQAGMIQRDVAPVITFLRRQFPSESPNNPDIKWKEAFEKYLKDQFEKFGLDPAACKADDLAENIEYIQPPTVSPVVPELLQTKSIVPVGSLRLLIEERNVALADFKPRIRKNSQLMSSDEIQSLYTAESLFQKIYQHRHHALLIGADDHSYQASYQKMCEALITAFRTKSLSSHFHEIKSEYLKALNALEKKSHYELIQNFLVNGRMLRENLHTVHRLIRESGNNPFLISDENLNKWLQENASSEYPGAIDVSPYEINRILLHSLLTNDRDDQRSDQFFQALELVCNWLLEPEKPTDSVSKKSLKKNYPTALIQGLLIPVILKKEPETLQDKLIAVIKTKDDFFNLLRYLNPDHCKMVCITIKDELFKRIWVTDRILDLAGEQELISLTHEQSKAVFEALKDILLKMVKNMQELSFVLNQYCQPDSDQHKETIIERLLKGDILLEENDLYSFRQLFSVDQYTKIVCDYNSKKEMFEIFSKFSTCCSPQIHFNHMIAGIKNGEKVLMWLCDLYQHIEGLSYDISFYNDMKLERLKHIKNKILECFREHPFGSAKQLDDNVAKKAIEVLERRRTPGGCAPCFFRSTSSKDPAVVAYRDHFDKRSHYPK